MSISDPVEWFPLVDEDGKTIGKAPRHVCHDGISFLLHPVVHLHVFNSNGELFIQKRSSVKDIEPGKWDTSVGGHVSPGESVEDALMRETFEELGLTGLMPVFLGKYIWKSSREKELINSFSVITDVIPVINAEEIEEGRFWSLDSVAQNLGSGIFTPNFEHEFRLFIKPA